MFPPGLLSLRKLYSQSICQNINVESSTYINVINSFSENSLRWFIIHAWLWIVGFLCNSQFSLIKIETCILSSVKQFASPGWMQETSARGWCTGKTQRDGMGREVEGGSSWGTHVNAWLIHVNVWQKPLQYCKVISLQLIKIN